MLNVFFLSLKMYGVLLSQMLPQWYLWAHAVHFDENCKFWLQKVTCNTIVYLDKTKIISPTLYFLIKNGNKNLIQ